MEHKHLQKQWLLYCFLAVLLSLPCNNYAQSVKRQCISSYGPGALTGNISIEQTAGQGFNTTNAAENKISVLHGFQQPVSFSVEDISANPLKSLNLSVYPNPAVFSVTVQSEEEIEESYIRVVDINGRYVLSEKVSNWRLHSINCESWTNGIYFITISDNTHNCNSLKIVINK